MAPPLKNDASDAASTSKQQHQHGVHGVYYGGSWVDLEDCADTFLIDEQRCSGCDYQDSCPRSASRNYRSNEQTDSSLFTYDVCIIGAGCIGSAIARELSKYQLHVLLLEAADDVSQGATKGNSGIVHAGYDDKPGSLRAKYCWPGNQMFAQLDRELRFGYQRNGSLVVATSRDEVTILEELLQRGKVNGVQNLRIVQQAELRKMEPYIAENAVAALYSPDAGNVIPYEYAIALAENAVDNGVELRIRRKVVNVTPNQKSGFVVEMDHWEPQEYVQAMERSQMLVTSSRIVKIVTVAVGVHHALSFFGLLTSSFGHYQHLAAVVALFAVAKLLPILLKANKRVTKNTPIAQLVEQAGMPDGKAKEQPQQHGVTVDDMLVGGSGAANTMHGRVVEREQIHCRFVINCAGGAADQIAALIGDDSFKIKPRLGDYILLHRNQGHLTRHTIFPCPDPVLGKGVLVQQTLWGNLILGPTARDTYKVEARDMTQADIQEYILSKCKALVPSFDPKETIHAFCGARAKSDRGDWIIESSQKNSRFIHVAGIDSPGLAGSPAIALDVVELLRKEGLRLEKDPSFNPNRAPIITPKAGMKGLKMGPVGKNDSDGSNTRQMEQNVICKCEKVTEMEVVRAMRRSLPIDSSQGIRKRTRAGMGHCQGDPDNYNCEGRVRAIIARENGVPVDLVGKRPWPATSSLTERWIGNNEKQQLKERMQIVDKRK
ncbi:hypothetical protein MPSEU_000931200 [Mayamaea pseudoterrestris]|nr:hypothetical protein MPSEU_000931200 [Mayamaea pseudoterrestris]